jgi:hypothetical protein
VSGYQPFDDLDTETEAALRTSIRRFGVVMPVVVDGNGRIIDGHQRARIAGELGLTYPVIRRSVRNDDDAMALALSLNSDRRHLDPEQRRQIVADLRSQGFSLRAIAGVTRTSVTQTRRDIEHTGAAPEAEVTGRDGKTYSSGVPGGTPERSRIVDPETGEILTPDAPAPRPPKDRAATLLADLSARRADVAKWLAFDQHDEVVRSMTPEQRKDYRSFVHSVWTHASTTLDLLDDGSRLRAVK